MPAQPNILFLTHRVPHPPNRGDRIRSWNMLRFLSARANIHLACLTDEPVSGISRNELNRVCPRVEIQQLSSSSRWTQGTWSLLAGSSATEGMFKSRLLKAKVRQWARDTQFDAVLVFCSSMFQYADCPEFRDVPLVVDLVDVDSEKWLNYAETAPFLKRQLFRLEAKRVRKLEMKIASRAKAVTLVSEEEVQVFRKFCNSNNVHAISNGVDLDYFHPATANFISEQETQAGTKPFKLVFVGVLDYRANIEGLRWFCREVWPEVREKIPGIELDLVGRRPGDAARQLAALPGVNLIGEVDDVRPYVWKADVVIAPLTIARGIQNKVLEAMAMAKPIIATPQAIEGTGARAGEHLLAFSDHNDWIASITDLFEARFASSRLSHAARAYVARDHVWEACLDALPTLLAMGEMQDSFHSRTRESDARLISMTRFS